MVGEITPVDLDSMRIHRGQMHLAQIRSIALHGYYIAIYLGKPGVLENQLDTTECHT